MNKLFLAGLCLLSVLPAWRAAAAQNDEYQVSLLRGGTLPSGVSRITLQSNYFPDGTKGIDGTPFTRLGTYGNDGDAHETLEIAQGIKPWLQLTLYTFSAVNGDRGLEWSGNHIKPTFTLQQSKRRPVRLSLGIQGGYQQARYAVDTWKLELRPGLERRIGRAQIAFSPLLLRSLHGPGEPYGWSFAANVRGSYRISRLLNVSFIVLRANEAQQQLFPLVTFHLPRNWDVSTGVGIRPEQTAQRYIPRLLIGRRFRVFKRASEPARPVLSPAGTEKPDSVPSGYFR